MNHIYCKTCFKLLGKTITLSDAQDVLIDHFKTVGHREIQIFRYKLAYDNFIKNTICDNCDKIHCHKCKAENVCLLGGRCVDCYYK